MSKGTTRRTVRIEDGLWEAAQERASERGEYLSDVIRESLRSYARPYEPRVHQDADD